MKTFSWRNQQLRKRLRILTVGLLAGAVTSCSLVSQKLDANKFYKRDIYLTINGVPYDGIAVPQKAPSYKIKVRARGVIDLITVRSCHREITYEEPSKGWFSSGKTFEFEYKPIAGIEDGKGCLLDIGTFEKIKGRHGWALVAFESDQENVTALLKCNGERRGARNVSICQARQGTIQQIRFDHRMKVSPDGEKCSVMKTKDEMNYQYIMPLGECLYYFCDQLGYCHQHITVGYEDLLVRKVGE